MTYPRSFSALHIRSALSLCVGLAAVSCVADTSQWEDGPPAIDSESEALLVDDTLDEEANADGENLAPYDVSEDDAEFAADDAVTGSRAAGADRALGVAEVRPADLLDCIGFLCGKVENNTNRHIKVKYSQGGETHEGYVSPHTSWGGGGKDMDWFYVPPGCTYHGTDGPYYPLNNNGYQRGALDDGGTLHFDRAVCGDASSTNSAAAVRNGNEWLEGFPPGSGCPAGNFCLYTEPNFKGSVYRLYHCKTYPLESWSGVGSWKNNNTGGAHGQIRGKNQTLLKDAKAGESNANYNFDPAWFVTPC